jgi:bacillithiol system protein YtxJ
MSTPFNPVADGAALEAQFTASHTHPVVLFQHDPWCGISTDAHKAVATLPWPVAFVDVARQPALSRAIADRTGVRHESPQVLVLRDGLAVWSASHRAITATGVATAFQQQPLAVQQSGHPGEALRRVPNA